MRGAGCRGGARGGDGGAPTRVERLERAPRRRWRSTERQGEAGAVVDAAAVREGERGVEMEAGLVRALGQAIKARGWPQRCATAHAGRWPRDAHGQGAVGGVHTRAGAWEGEERCALGRAGFGQRARIGALAH